MFDEEVYGYSRKQAIEDGVLLDLSHIAGYIGFNMPLAVTPSVWSEFIDGVKPGFAAYDPQLSESEKNRNMICLAIALRNGIVESKKTATGDETTLYYRLEREENGDYKVHVGRTWEWVEQQKLAGTVLKMVCGPGDNLEPVLTVMDHTED
ncbi:DUF6573 family protein [Chitinibacter tainanensis]|uniref:DUF6573 family protein n=1 Tax=Chitinibacter tainanensis TaxID=230667 RepID=UPI0004294573|nr:DUF6573 family protein [Chitinibacter tainanensis]